MLGIRNRWNESSFGRAFIVTFFFVTLAAGLFWLDFFRSYSTEVTVLIVSRSNTIEKSSSVADNMAELIRTLSFYNRLLTENDSIDDDFEGFAPDKRKESWNNVVSVTKQNASGVLAIRAIGDTPEKSKLLATQTAQTLFSIAGLYYNVKTDVDMRIVDGPLVSYTLQKPFLYIGMSLLTSLSLTSLFFFFLRAVPELIGRKKERLAFSDAYPLTGDESFDELGERRIHPEFDVNETAPWIDPKKFIPEKPHTLSFERSPQEEELIYGIHGTRNVKHASAPKNLPVASDELNLPVADEASLPFEFETLEEETEIPEAESFEDEAMSVGEESSVSSTPVAPEHREPASTTLSASASLDGRGEPTQEDYKRRLNELLANVK